MITRRCNLNCTYCYEEHKCNDIAFDMTFETAKRLLLAEFSFVRSSPEFDEIEIDFMGGEPFMNFPLIKQVVEWLEQEPPQVPYVCFATTNGTLLAEHKEWLSKHRERFVLGGSFDGTDEMQVANRGTNDDLQTCLALLKEFYPMQGLHMTVSKETLPFLSSGILALQRRGFRVEVALAQGVDWSDSDAKMYRLQLEMLADAYLVSDRDLSPVSLLSRHLGGIDGRPEVSVQRKYCGTGTHMVAYDVDGQKYGCHLFTPVVLGEYAVDMSQIDFSCETVTEDSFCKSCILKVVCPTCAGFNLRYRGDISARDHRWCGLMIAQFQVASIFQQKYIAALERPSDEDVSRLWAAVKAYEVLSEIDDKACPFQRKRKE